MTQWTGSKLALHVEGLSHGPELTAVLEGLPADVHIDKGGLERFMARRAPGQGSWSTPRKEPDAVEFSSGLREVEGANNSAGAYETTGGPLKLRIANTNTRSGDYAASTLVPRPGHADYAYYMQSGHPIEPGGGAFSGRLTAPVCAYICSHG